ncbi:hypothetical protein BpHYR1_044852 [Brachionus plicatilis]|uniref:RNA-directed DNA polymerase from mobile element jockey-like n=1 Tax=Brachionus plicatilis TaxID=10195 RepID=A0A3M7QUM5_BRAPC|nr:hypothetical protein BpHYR1_044852 [Brachionus plicatilis]
MHIPIFRRAKNETSVTYENFGNFSCLSVLKIYKATSLNNTSLFTLFFFFFVFNPLNATVAMNTSAYLIYWIKSIYGNKIERQKDIKFLGIKFDTVRSILKLKYDTPSNILHHEACNKLKLLSISNRLCELSERYIRAGLRALARYRYTNK